MKPILLTCVTSIPGDIAARVCWVCSLEGRLWERELTERKSDFQWWSTSCARKPAHLEAIGCRWKREAPLVAPPCWGSHSHLHQQNSEPANVSFQRSIEKPWKSHIQAAPETGNALYHLNNLSFRRHIAVRARTFSHRISHLKRNISNCVSVSINFWHTLVFSCQFCASQ